MKILSCEHCQTIEDSEIVLGSEKPVLLSDTNLVEAVCPNCRAQLRDWEFILVNLSWITKPLQYQTAKAGGF